jgi:flagellar basal-body rod modification protein FlgD
MSIPISFVPTPTTPTTGAADSAASLADNFDTFLNILTAQIQNQDPLEPMDSSQFTQQLVQFSGVEQQIKSNKSLEALLAASKASTGAALSGYLGQEAEIDSAGAAFTGDPVHWRYYLPSDAASTTVTVTDAKGKVLYSKAGELEAGAHDLTWDGVMNNGKVAETDQAYRISVVSEDANGKALTPKHSLVTTITGVDLSYGEPALTTSAGIFTYADILRLTRQ